jgi:hypothetical protein
MNPEAFVRNIFFTFLFTFYMRSYNNLIVHIEQNKFRFNGDGLPTSFSRQFFRFDYLKLAPENHVRKY